MLKFLAYSGSGRLIYSYSFALEPVQKHMESSEALSTHARAVPCHHWETAFDLPKTVGRFFKAISYHSEADANDRHRTEMIPKDASLWRTKVEPLFATELSCSWKSVITWPLQALQKHILGLKLYGSIWIGLVFLCFFIVW